MTLTEAIDIVITHINDNREGKPVDADDLAAWACEIDHGLFDYHANELHTTETAAGEAGDSIMVAACEIVRGVREPDNDCNPDGGWCSAGAEGHCSACDAYAHNTDED